MERVGMTNQVSLTVVQAPARRGWNVRSAWMPARRLTAALLFLAVSAAARLTVAEPPITQPIINGSAADPAASPWMAALVDRKFEAEFKTRAPFCGAMLIAPDRVLTAAHCAGDYVTSPAAVGVVLASSAGISETSVKPLAVREIHVHPNFNPDTLEFDAAILVLKAASTVTPVTVAQAETEAALLEAGAANATVLGWGAVTTTMDFFPEQLQIARVPIHPAERCRQSLGHDFTPATMLCAGVLSSTAVGADGVDTCVGDSGGPLFVSTAEGPQLVGLTSWGYECASPRYYGVYARLSAFSAFISKEIDDSQRAAGKISVRGSPVVGKILQCISRSKDPLSEIEWQADGVTISKARGPILPLTVVLAGAKISCSRSRSSGGTAHSDSVGPVRQPVNTFSNSNDRKPPAIRAPRVRCHGGSCVLVSSITDRGSGVSAVAAWVRGERRVRHTRITGRSLALAQRAGSGRDWSAQWRYRGHEWHRVTIWAIDRAGNTIHTEHSVLITDND